MDEHVEQYEKPRVEDLGQLQDLTQASGFVGAEDGGNKLLIHHISPNPSAPAGP